MVVLGQSFNAITEIESKLKRNLEIMPMAKWKIIFAWVVSVSGCSLGRNEINEGKRVQSKRKMHIKSISTANENDREKSSTEELFNGNRPTTRLKDVYDSKLFSVPFKWKRVCLLAQEWLIFEVMRLGTYFFLPIGFEYLL